MHSERSEEFLYRCERDPLVADTCTGGQCQGERSLRMTSPFLDYLMTVGIPATIKMTWSASRGQALVCPTQPVTIDVSHLIGGDQA